MTKFIHELFFKFHALLLCLFYGAIFAASVLGITGFFQPLNSILLATFVTIALFCFYIRKGMKDLADFSGTVNKPDLPSGLNLLILIGSVSLIVALFLLPVARWPQSVAGDWFPWDAGAYHFPKAVELFRTGHMNDMTISYSEYPIGYESLLALGLSIVQNDTLFGPIHALINLFFILTVWLLAVRYTRIPPSLAMLFVILMLVSGTFLREFNIWGVFRLEMQNVGKNDLFLASTTLSVLLFFPLSGSGGIIKKYLLPFSISSMLALSIKPNAVIVLTVVWAAVIIHILIKRPNQHSESVMGIKNFVIPILLILPGGLWVLRNLIFQGAIFTQGILEGSRYSISANLSNPDFFPFIPPEIWIISAICVLVFIISTINFSRFKWHAFFIAVLLISFVLTPYVLVFEMKETPVQINMRFAHALVVYLYLMIMIVIENPIKIILEGINQSSLFRLIFQFFLVIGVMGLFYTYRGVLRVKPENDIIRRDQFHEPVGVDGYHSAYDFVQNNIRNSVVWVENGLPYFIYGPGFTNTPSRQTKADYIVVLKTDWFGLGGFDAPRYFPPDWREVFEIVYEDRDGVVIKYQEKQK